MTCTGAGLTLMHDLRGVGVALQQSHVPNKATHLAVTSTHSFPNPFFHVLATCCTASYNYAIIVQQCSQWTKAWSMCQDWLASVQSMQRPTQLMQDLPTGHVIDAKAMTSSEHNPRIDHLVALSFWPSRLVLYRG